MEKRLMNKKGLLISLFLFIILGINFCVASISVIAPGNYTNYSRSSLVAFNVSYINGTDFTDAKNASFYYNLSGAWTFIGNTILCKKAAAVDGVGSCNGSLNISGLTDGRYSINATLYNMTAVTKTANASVLTHNIIFDSTPPSVSAFYTSTNNGNYSGTISLNVSVSDGLVGMGSVYFNVTNSSGIQVNFTKGSASEVYYNLTFLTSGLVDGKYNITIYANDTLNNLNNTERIQITIDNTAPTSLFSCVPNAVTSSATVTCSCLPEDATSGINSSATSYTTNPSVANIGSFTVSCSFADLAGNTGTKSTTYTVSSTNSEVAATSTATAKKINSWTKITPGTATIMKDFKEEFGIKQIQIEVNNEAQNVKISIINYEEKPAEVSVQKTGKVYKYLHIQEENLQDKLEKAILTIQVKKSWILNNSIDKNNLNLFKFDETSKEWTELSTTLNSENNIYYYYNIELTSFSYFAIGEKENVISEEETINEIPQETKNYIWIVIIVVAVLAIILIIFKIKKRKKK